MSNEQQPTTAECITCHAKFNGSWTGECPECEQKALRRFVNSNPTTTGEWVKHEEREGNWIIFCNHERINRVAIPKQAATEIESAHNAAITAALAAEREKWVGAMVTDHNERIAEEIQQLRERLASATARELHSYDVAKQCRDELAAEREKVEALVDALKSYEYDSNGHIVTWLSEAAHRDALAKVKERK